MMIYTTSPSTDYLLSQASSGMISRDMSQRGSPTLSASSGDAGKAADLVNDDGWTTVQKKRDKAVDHRHVSTSRSSSEIAAGSSIPRSVGDCERDEREKRPQETAGEACRIQSASSSSNAQQATSSVLTTQQTRISTPKTTTTEAATKKRRQHGSNATGIVKRRDEWQDHCLIDMEDGLEDVFCHRHRCQGKALPPTGTRVRFKLHLSTKSLCWQSGFVSWDEAEQPDFREEDDAKLYARRARGEDDAGEAKKENVPADGNILSSIKSPSASSPLSSGFFLNNFSSGSPPQQRRFLNDAGFLFDEDNTASTAEIVGLHDSDDRSSDRSTSQRRQQQAWGTGLPGDDDQLLQQSNNAGGDNNSNNSNWDTERGWADLLMGKILAANSNQQNASGRQTAGSAHYGSTRSSSPVQGFEGGEGGPPGLLSSSAPTMAELGVGGLASMMRHHQQRDSGWREQRQERESDENSRLRQDLLVMMANGRQRSMSAGRGMLDDSGDAVIHPQRVGSSSSFGGRGGFGNGNTASKMYPSDPRHLPTDRITLRVVAVDEPKLPWLATAELPIGRAGPIYELREWIDAAVEAGNASAIQKLKRRRETRKRAKRGDHCRVEVVDRRGGAIRVDAFAVNAAGAGAALRSMLDANADALRRRAPGGVIDEAEMFANLGWAQLVSQLETVLAKCGEPDGICCNHLSRAFEKEFGSALVETLFGDFESLAALLRAPQLRGIVDLNESPGRPDLAVSLARGRRHAYHRRLSLTDRTQLVPAAPSSFHQHHQVHQRNFGGGTLSTETDDTYRARTTAATPPLRSPPSSFAESFQQHLSLNRSSVSHNRFDTQQQQQQQQQQQMQMLRSQRRVGASSSSYGSDIFGRSSPRQSPPAISESGSFLSGRPPLMPTLEHDQLVPSSSSLLRDDGRSTFYDQTFHQHEPRRPMHNSTVGSRTAAEDKIFLPRGDADDEISMRPRSLSAPSPDEVARSVGFLSVQQQESNSSRF